MHDSKGKVKNRKRKAASIELPAAPLCIKLINYAYSDITQKRIGMSRS